MSDTYKAIYKCCLCGKKFPLPKIEIYSDNIEKIISDFQLRSYASGRNYLLHLTEKHRCKDGSLGFADFQGFKKE
ncbi:hypothetical protein C8E03_108177 [Lachnotalea glycerini]|uniref:Uncharacterized protein n=1 Tax=Lachnotalea glycerini TaxID=1763509 RepID=A0A318EQS8_9FIRM|nr:hypothetical protein [Lachnotalea glycerini]OYO76126.1 hypothetical protein CG709_16150 [Lachnotalea glycerini]PXV88450.1 hypothetical protein C8E03_108177 [Lachnotalea glycerini]